MPTGQAGSGVSPHRPRRISLEWLIAKLIMQGRDAIAQPRRDHLHRQGSDRARRARSLGARFLKALAQWAASAANAFPGYDDK